VLDLNDSPQEVPINSWNATHDAALFQFELEGNPGLYFVQVVLENGITVVEKIVNNDTAMPPQDFDFRVKLK